MKELKEVPQKIQLPVPEANVDLPENYTFDGWHRASNPSSIGEYWYAYITWSKPEWPPMVQQVAISLAEALSMKPKTLIKYVKDQIVEAVRLNEISLRELGWAGKGDKRPNFANWQP
jgi:hypothetical protein